MKNLIVLLLVIGSLPLCVEAQSVIRGPYLQNASANHITIKWRTDQPTQSKVNFGDSPNNLNINYFDAAWKTDHEVEIVNLNPHTTYYYNIANANTVLVPAAHDLYFKTHPTNEGSAAYKFWILGDSGTADADARNVRDAYYNYIGNQHTDGILFLGDNAYGDGTDSEYQNAVFENMYEDKLKNSIAWSTMGNHDGHSANSNAQTGPYFDIFTFPTNGGSGGVASGTEAYYSFDYGNIHFICLDSYGIDRSEGATMYDWCQKDIQNTNQEWIVAFWHHPPYSKGSHDSDSEIELKEMRTNYLPMLEDNGVDLVMSGHSHSYERTFFINGHYGNSNSFNPNHIVGTNGSGDGRANGNGAYVKDINGYNAGDGAVYVVAGSSGKVTEAPLDHEAMYYSVAALGSCVLEVDGDELEVKFIQDNGSVSDYFSIHKNEVDCAIGTACNDQDPCTLNDAWNSDCNCEGTPAIDSDNDGVCDDYDCHIWNPFFPALPGSSCDDGNPSTPFDVVLADSCTCAGFYEVPCIVEASVLNNIITIGGLPSDANARIFDQNWDPIWDCNPWTGNACNIAETYVADNGIYNISVNAQNCEFYQQVIVNNVQTGCTDNDNDGICEEDDCNDADASIPAAPNTPCNDGNAATENDVIQADGCSCLGAAVNECNIVATSNEGVISISGLAGTSTKIFDSNWTAVWECNTWTNNPCSNFETYPSGEGTFYISSQSINCDFFTTLEVANAACDDDDYDGVCNQDDCEPYNPALPTTPNTPCFDGNPNTVNDVYQADGCTCMGTLITTETGCNIMYAIGPNNVSFGNLTDDIVTVNLFDVNNNEVFGCGTWRIPCSESEVASNLSSGIYYINIESFTADWTLKCDVNKLISVGENLFGTTDMISTNTKNETTFRLYPNPTSGILNLDLTNFENTNIIIDIYDFLGQQVYSKSINDSSNSIYELNLAHFQNGVYSLSFIVDGENQYYRTFIVRQ